MSAARPYAIALARSDADIADAIALAWAFFAYVKTFPGMADDVDGYIADHQVKEKFAAFADHFLPPVGDCLLARGPEGAPLGVVMLTTISPERCEMNRMFVTEAARGTGLGRALGEALLARAREMGFTVMTLDTLKILEAAVGLYRALGFEEFTAPDTYKADDPRGIAMRLSLSEGLNVPRNSPTEFRQNSDEIPIAEIEP